jgi:hypothetical protein
MNALSMLTFNSSWVRKLCEHIGSSVLVVLSLVPLIGGSLIVFLTALFIGLVTVLAIMVVGLLGGIGYAILWIGSVILSASGVSIETIVAWLNHQTVNERKT